MALKLEDMSDLKITKDKSEAGGFIVNLTFYNTNGVTTIKQIFDVNGKIISTDYQSCDSHEINKLNEIIQAFLILS